MKEGWIKIHYKILEWEWYGDPNMVALWIHILVSANWKDKKWRGKTIKRGQLLTSRSHLADETGLSEQQVRRCLSRLQESEEITCETTNKNTMITICKYDSYQCENVSEQPAEQPTSNQQTTNKQPTNNQQTTTTEESNNIILKEDNIKNKKLRAGENLGIFENVNLSDSDIERIRMNFANEGLDDDFILRCIDKLSSFLHEGNGAHYKSHAAAITLWVKTSVLEDDRRTGKTKQRQTQQDPFFAEKQVWASFSEQDKQEYLKAHGGKHPWEE